MSKWEDELNEYLDDNIPDEVLQDETVETRLLPDLSRKPTEEARLSRLRDLYSTDYSCYDNSSEGDYP